MKRGVAILLVLMALACRRVRQTPSDTLIVVVEQEMRTADPRFVSNSYEAKLSRLVAPGLTAVDTPDLRPRLALARAIEQLDARTWVVTLRDDARFWDGHAVTAGDVVWTYESILATDSKSVLRDGFRERFAKVESLDQQRIRFVLKEPLASFLSDIDIGVLAKDAPRLMGAGNYELASLTPSKAWLRRVAHADIARAHLANIELQYVGDENARILMLIGGTADLAQNAVRLDLVGDIERRARIRLISAPSSVATYLLMNNDDELLRDVRVRRAIAMAIDRETIVKAKLQSRATLATSILPTSNWAYEPNVRRYEFDVAGAKALLDEAGVTDPDGDGPQPRMTLTYKTSKEPFRIMIARVISEQLRRVGIEVDVRPFERATFLADIKQGNYQLASQQNDISEPNYFHTYYHSSRIPSSTNPDYHNRWRYRNPTIDALTEAGRTTSDATQRKAIYRQVQEILADDVPMLPLWHEDNIVFTNRSVHGYLMSPNARLTGLELVAKD